MNSQDVKTSKLIDILASPWSTSDFFEEKLTITGMRKTDTLELDSSEIIMLTELLDHENSKVVLGAIKLIGLFGKNAKSQVDKIVKHYDDYSNQQKIEVILSLKRIGTKETIEKYKEIINKETDYDVLFDLVFYLSELLVKYPIAGINTLLECSKREDIWGVIKSQFQESIAKSDQNKGIKKIDVKILEPPPGISQEAEQKRIQINLTRKNIAEAIIKINHLAQSDDKKTHKEAKKTLQQIRKKVQ